MFARYLLTIIFMLTLAVFGQYIVPHNYVPTYRLAMSVFWQFVSFGGLMLLISRGMEFKKKGKFKIPHLKF